MVEKTVDDYGTPIERTIVTEAFCCGWCGVFGGCRGYLGNSPWMLGVVGNVEERWFASRFKKEFWKIERRDLDIVYIYISIYVHTYSCVFV